MLVVECTLQGQQDGKYYHCMFSVKKVFQINLPVDCWSENLGFHSVALLHSVNG